MRAAISKTGGAQVVFFSNFLSSLCLFSIHFLSVLLLFSVVHIPLADPSLHLVFLSCTCCSYLFSLYLALISYFIRVKLPSSLFVFPLTNCVCLLQEIAFDAHVSVPDFSDNQILIKVLMCACVCICVCVCVIYVCMHVCVFLTTTRLHKCEQHRNVLQQCPPI
jgi:hypothetical protein